MPDSTSLVADTIIRTVEFGLTITGVAIDEHRTWITCRPVEQDASCPGYGMDGRVFCQLFACQKSAENPAASAGFPAM